MSAGLGVLRRVLTHAAASGVPVALEKPGAETEVIGADQLECLALQQIRGLVRSVFLPGWPRPAHQVVFSAADEYSDGGSLCFRAAELLANEGRVNVCLVEANLRKPTLEQSFGGTCTDGAASGPAPGTMRKSSRQIQQNLWLVPRDAFFGTPDNAANLPWLRSRMGELRREFDYSVIHGSPAGESGGSSLLAHLADGLVLTVDAERTRRATAQRARQQLASSNVRLMGAVLLDRSFPIPERLYRRI